MEKFEIMDIEYTAEQLKRQLLAECPQGLIGKDFQKALPYLRKSALYRLFYAMPKGRLMHAHIEATFDAHFALAQAFSSSDTYVFLAEETPQFRHMQLAHKAWFAGGEIPAGWEKISAALAEDPQLRDRIYDMCTSDIENIDENIWPKFEAIFDRYKALNNYVPFFKKVYTKVLSDMAAEGLMGVDFRYISQTLFDKSGHRLESDEYVDLVREIEREVQKTYPYFRVRLIYSYYKGVPADTVPERLEYARHLVEKYPDTVIGFDMVGEEDCGKDLKYYGEVLSAARVPVIMHAGETVDPENRNVKYAMQLDISRIGHGMNLYRYPQVEEIVNERGVMLEVCPLSNQLLGYVPDLRQHPAAGYIKRGLNVTISSDDCAIFGTNYITDDLVLAYLNWDLTMADIKRCLLNSLEGDPALTSLFESQWHVFENTL